VLANTIIEHCRESIAKLALCTHSAARCPGRTQHHDRAGAPPDTVERYTLRRLTSGSWLDRDRGIPAHTWTGTIRCRSAAVPDPGSGSEICQTP